jgi:hypothetical protein
MEGPWGGWRRAGSCCEAGFEAGFEAGSKALPLPVCIASILDVRPARQFTNSDVFFAFSAIHVLFRQVGEGEFRTVVRAFAFLLHCG